MAQERNPLTIETIEQAVQGNPAAMEHVLQHYERYMIQLSTRKTYGEDGAARYTVDETLLDRLWEKLMGKILEFEIRSPL